MIGGGNVSSRSGPCAGLHCSSGNTLPLGSVTDLGGEYIAIQPLITDCGDKHCVSNGDLAPEETRPGRKGGRSRLTAEENTPQDRLRYRVVRLGQPRDEVMQIPILHELERQHCRVTVDILPHILNTCELGGRGALRGDYFSPPKPRLYDMPGPPECLE